MLELLVLRRSLLLLEKLLRQTMQEQQEWHIMQVLEQRHFPAILLGGVQAVFNNRYMAGRLSSSRLYHQGDCHGNKNDKHI
jgi:hypothetical protein